jgi:catechol-2,3-dioxygenase
MRGVSNRLFAVSIVARHIPRMSNAPIDPAVRIGHVHLKVANLERALGFYRDVLGFAVTQRMGQQAAFLSAGGYHHHIGLNTWESAGGRRRRGRRGCITWRSCIRRGRSWAMRCGG